MGVVKEPAFPTEGIVPEHRQIGRVSAIDGLEKRLRSGGHWAMIDDRKIGKSSVGTAVLHRLASDPDIAPISVDLRQLAVRDEAQLVAALRAAGARAGIDAGDLKQLGRRAKGLLHGKAPAAIATIGTLLGIEEVADTAQIAATLGATLGGERPVDLRQQLLTFEAWAVARDRTVVLFIDEVQDLARWGGATVEDLAAAMSRPLKHVRLLFAGSERHSMKALFAAGQPLHDHALDFEVPAIAPADWMRALPERFAEVGYTIDRAALTSVVDATIGRPLRTNQACFQAMSNAPDYNDGERHITTTVMQYAIGLVREREQWPDDADDDA